MAFFRRRRTLKRCQTLKRYMSNLDDMRIQQMTEFLMQDKCNTVCLSKEFLTFVSASGAVALAIPAVIADEDFDTITLSSSWARVAGSTKNDGTFSGSDGGSYTNNNNNNNNNNG